MTTCTINKTQNYIETVSFRSIAALPDHFEILIRSQLLDAKDPSALNVKYRTVASVSALSDLRETLNKVLDSQIYFGDKTVS